MATDWPVEEDILTDVISPFDDALEVHLEFLHLVDPVWGG